MAKENKKVVFSISGTTANNIDKKEKNTFENKDKKKSKITFSVTGALPPKQTTQEIVKQKNKQTIEDIQSDVNKTITNVSQNIKKETFKQIDKVSQNFKKPLNIELPEKDYNIFMGTNKFFVPSNVEEPASSTFVDTNIPQTNISNTSIVKPEQIFTELKPKVYVISEDASDIEKEEPEDYQIEDKYKTLTIKDMNSVFKLFDNLPIRDLSYYQIEQKITDKERKETLRLLKEKFGDEDYLIETIGKGALQGIYDIMYANSFTAKLLGQIVNFKQLKNMANVSLDYWQKKIDNVEINKDILENPFETGDFKKLVSPSWLAYNVARMFPGVLMSVGAGYLGENILQQFIKPEKLPVIARFVYKAIKPSMIGYYAGSLEGASTYRVVKDAGGTEEDAIKAGILMSCASAYLNALSLEKLFNFMSKNTFGNFVSGLLTEVITEYAEEPAEGLILLNSNINYNAENFRKQLRDGLAVIPPTIVASILTYGLGSIYNFVPKNQKEDKAKKSIIDIIEKNKNNFQGLDNIGKDKDINRAIIEKISKYYEEHKIQEEQEQQKEENTDKEIYNLIEHIKEENEEDKKQDENIVQKEDSKLKDNITEEKETTQQIKEIETKQEKITEEKQNVSSNEEVNKNNEQQNKSEIRRMNLTTEDIDFVLNEFRKELSKNNILLPDDIYHKIIDNFMDNVQKMDYNVTFNEAMKILKSMLRVYSKEQIELLKKEGKSIGKIYNNIENSIRENFLKEIKRREEELRKREEERKREEYEKTKENIKELADIYIKIEKEKRESEKIGEEIENLLKKHKHKNTKKELWNNFVSFFEFLNNDILADIGIFENLDTEKFKEVVKEYRYYQSSVVNTANLYIKELTDLLKGNLNAMATFALWIENPTKYEAALSEQMDIKKAERAKELLFKIDGLNKKILNEQVDKIISAIAEKGIKLSNKRIGALRDELDYDNVFGGNNIKLQKVYAKKIKMKLLLYVLLKRIAQSKPGDLGILDVYDLVMNNGQDALTRAKNDYSELLFTTNQKEVLDRLLNDVEISRMLSESASELNIDFDIITDVEEWETDWSLYKVDLDSFISDNEYKTSVLQAYKDELKKLQTLYTVVKKASEQKQTINYMPMNRLMTGLHEKLLTVLEASLLKNKVNKDGVDSYILSESDIKRISNITGMPKETIERFRKAYETNDYFTMNKIVSTAVLNEKGIEQLYVNLIKKGYSPKKVSTIIKDLEKEEHGRLYLYEIFKDLPQHIQMKYLDPYMSAIYHIVTTSYKYAERNMILKLLKTPGVFITNYEYTVMPEEEKKYYAYVPSEILQDHPYLTDFYAHKVFISFYGENLSRSFENFPIINSIRKMTTKLQVLSDLVFLNPMIMGRLNFDQTSVSKPSGLPYVLYTFMTMLFKPKTYFKYYTIALNTGMMTERTEKTKMLRKSIKEDIEKIAEYSSKQSVLNMIKYNLAMSENEEERSKFKFLYDYTINIFKTFAFEIIDKGFKVGITKLVYDRYYNSIKNMKDVEKMMIKNKISYFDIENISDFNNIEVGASEFEKIRHRLSILLTRKYFARTQLPSIIGEFGSIPHTTSVFLRLFALAYDIRFAYSFAFIKGALKFVSREPIKVLNSKIYKEGDIKTIDFEYIKDKEGRLKKQTKFNFSLINIILTAIVLGYFIHYLPRMLRGYYLRKGYALTERDIKDDLIFYELSGFEELANKMSFEYGENNTKAKIVDKYFDELEKGYGMEYYIARKIGKYSIFYRDWAKHSAVLEMYKNQLKNGEVKFNYNDLTIGVQKNIIPQDVLSAFLKILHKGWGGLMPVMSPFSAVISMINQLSEEGQIYIYDRYGKRILANYNDDLYTILKSCLIKYARDHTAIGNAIRILSDDRIEGVEKFNSVFSSLYFYYITSGKFLTDIVKNVKTAFVRPEVIYSIVYDSKGNLRNTDEQKYVTTYITSLVWSDKKEGIGAIQYRRATEHILKDLEVFGKDTEKELEFIRQSYILSQKNTSDYFIKKIMSEHTAYYNKILNGEITKEEAKEKLDNLINKYVDMYVKSYRKIITNENKEQILNTIKQSILDEYNLNIDKDLQEIENFKKVIDDLKNK